jgi:hypothetical protein
MCQACFLVRVGPPVQHRLVLAVLMALSWRLGVAVACQMLLAYNRAKDWQGHVTTQLLHFLLSCVL